ncbi:glucose-6-phosphate isomerase [Tissierella sp.]|uniref:glucose-6-phosphate isomerase n=1 Tax=Tissierella sp. TaxID=41274 RepID=UPI00304DBDDC
MKLSYSEAFISNEDLNQIGQLIKRNHNLLENKTGKGNDLLGWLDLPSNYDKNEFERIKNVACKIQNDSEVLIVIGVGGSYLGARACIEALNHSFYNILPKEKRRFPEVYFVGNNLSSKYLMDLIENIGDKDISLNVISKSGTTMEPSIAFRVLKNIMEKRYGNKGARNRIYITTDRSKGILRELSQIEGYESFVVPEDICGRYSVFTAVGLLPIAVTGIDIDGLMNGAYDGMIEYKESELSKNICYQYAAIRNILYKKGKDIEILANYEPSLFYLLEWWKQLFGESEGKDGNGIYPASANFTTDLHSFGQLIQDGKKNIFETIIMIEKLKEDLALDSYGNDFDGLNYLAGTSLNYINKKAFEGALEAHESGDIPNIVITLPELNEFYLGKLMYFFQKSCAISAYTQGVNPFDQPAVEKYKNNMYRLLGRNIEATTT